MPETYSSGITETLDPLNSNYRFPRPQNHPSTLEVYESRSGYEKI